MFVNHHTIEEPIPMDTQTKTEGKIIRLTIAGHGFTHFFEGAVPPLLPLLMMSFGVDYFRIGIVVTVFSYAYGVGSLPAGIITDKIGSKGLISFFFFGTSILSLTVVFIQGYYAFLLCMAAIGLIGSVYHPTANTLISHSVRERGRAYGIHGISGSLSLALTPAVAALMGARFGWKSAYYAAGLAGIFLALYSLTLPRDYRREAAEGKPDIREEAEHEMPSKMFLGAFFISAATLGMAYRGIMTFLPAYMAENFSMEGTNMDKVSIGGIIATLSLLSGTAGQYITGRIIDRKSPEKIYTLISFTGGGFVLLMSFTRSLPLLLSAICFAFFYFSAQPVQNYILAKHMPPRIRGLGFGAHFFMVFAVGSTAAAISGFLADRYGLSSVYLSMSGFFFLSGLMTLYLVRCSSKKTLNKQKI
jgi:predicted MFS family arabinose efflux permease